MPNTYTLIFSDAQQDQLTRAARPDFGSDVKAYLYNAVTQQMAFDGPGRRETIGQDQHAIDRREWGSMEGVAA